MKSEPFFSNNRPFTLVEAIFITVASVLPESAYEPQELRDFRKSAEQAFQTSKEIPGAILDSAVFELLRLGGKLS